MVNIITRIRNRMAFAKARLDAYFAQKQFRVRFENWNYGIVEASVDYSLPEVDEAADVQGQQFMRKDYPLKHYSAKQLLRMLNDYKNGRGPLRAGNYDFDGKKQVCALLRDMRIPHRLDFADGFPLVVIGEEIDQCLKCTGGCSFKHAYRELIEEGQLDRDLQILEDRDGLYPALLSLSYEYIPQASQLYLGILKASTYMDESTGRIHLQGAHCRIIAVNRNRNRKSQMFFMDYTTGAPDPVNNARGLDVFHGDSSDIPSHLYLVGYKQ